MRITPHPLIYDWNHDAAGPRPVAMLDDETLRDGLQSPSVRTPTIEEKIDILHRMGASGVVVPVVNQRMGSDTQESTRGLQAL